MTLPDRDPRVLDYVDSHCHLDHHEHVRVADQVAAAREAGVTTIVTVGTDLASSTEAVQTASRYDGVWAAVGVHPNDAMEATPAVVECIARLAGSPQVVAIGETGLDYYRDWAPVDRQKWAFREHIRLARELDRALVVHCRDAWDDLLAILEEEGAPERTVLHCFSGDADLADKCATAGYFVSFAGNVTFANAGSLREAAAAVPLGKLLTETDSPFLTPVPHRGKPNEPGNVVHTVRLIAEVRGEPEADVARAVSENACLAFSFPGL